MTLLYYTLLFYILMLDAVAIHYLLFLEPVVYCYSFFCVEVCHKNRLLHHVAVVLAKTRICADFTEQVNNIALKLGGFNISYLRIYSKIYTVFKKTFRFNLIFRAFFLHYLFFFIQGNLFLSYFRSIFHFYTPWNLAISNISFQL